MVFVKLDSFVCHGQFMYLQVVGGSDIVTPCPVHLATSSPSTNFMEKIKSSPVTENPALDKELKRLKKATEDFEQIFVNMMLKEMHKNLGESALLDGGDYQKMFKDMLIDERAKELSRNGQFGLAEQMYNQMKDLIAAQHRGSALTPNQGGSVSQPGELARQLSVERIANDYRRTKGNQK